MDSGPFNNRIQTQLFETSADEENGTESAMNRKSDLQGQEMLADLMGVGPIGIDTPNHFAEFDQGLLNQVRV